MSAEPPCYYCGNLGTESNPVITSPWPDDAETTIHLGTVPGMAELSELEAWGYLDVEGQPCPPYPRGWMDCNGACAGVLPAHLLVQNKDPDLQSNPPIGYCRDDADPGKLVTGGYVKIPCICDACVERTWRAVTGTGRAPRTGGRARARKEREPKVAAPKAPTTDERLREAIATEPGTTAELATRIGVSQRAVQLGVRSIGAVAERQGKSIRWGLPS